MALKALLIHKSRDKLQWTEDGAGSPGGAAAQSRVELGSSPARAAVPTPHRATEDDTVLAVHISRNRAITPPAKVRSVVMPILCSEQSQFKSVEALVRCVSELTVHEFARLLLTSNWDVELYRSQTIVSQIYTWLKTVTGHIVGFLMCASFTNFVCVSDFWRSTLPIYMWA